MKTINTDKAKELINLSKGRIFSAVFIKKDNTHRLINARLGKQYKSKTGKEAHYKPKEYNLLPVYEQRKSSVDQLFRQYAFLSFHISATLWRLLD